MSSIFASQNAVRTVLLLLCLLLHDAAAEWAETAKLTDMDGEADDEFGGAVAIDNGILVVGARYDNIGGATGAGSATIVELSGGEWVAPQKLTSSDAQAYDQFGLSVAISNGIVAVGAYGEDRAGAVHIYVKGEDGVWTELQKLIHSDAAAGDLFGTSLAMQGGTLVVGASGDDGGSVFIFTLSGDTWKLTATDGSADDHFGYSVAIDAGTIVVGALFDDDLGDRSGSAYVFQRTGEGSSWTQVAKLTPSDGQTNDWFGQAVVIEGGTIFVGSNNNADGEKVGAVYQFGEEMATWTQQSKLVPSELAPPVSLGSRGLAIRNGTLVVGMPANIGAAYVFQQESNAWTQRAKLVASDGATQDGFGVAAAVDDGMVIVGALGDNSWQGSVYAFEWLASDRPSIMPSSSSVRPTPVPSMGPSEAPSTQPSFLPTSKPSALPSLSAKPTTVPSFPPTGAPSKTTDMPVTEPPSDTPNSLFRTSRPTATTCEVHEGKHCPEVDACCSDKGVSYYMYRFSEPIDVNGKPLTCITECVPTTAILLYEMRGWSCGKCPCSY